MRLNDSERWRGGSVMSVFYLELTDMRQKWTMVRIDDDDDDWDQRSMHKGPATIASGRGRCNRFMQLINLFDHDTDEKVVQIQLGSGQRIRRGEKGSGICGSASPALKDGPIQWECTAWYEDDD